MTSAPDELRAIKEVMKGGRIWATILGEGKSYNDPKNRVKKIERQPNAEGPASLCILAVFATQF